jgi:dTDP-4-amino-4,6-dideoxygalactose transaminase
MKKEQHTASTLSEAQTFALWPCFAEDEIEAAAAVLRSGNVNYWTGTEGRLFEAEFASFAGCRYAVAVANGTVALELALRALGVGPGDEVVTSSRTFIATASSVVAVGARPVFADVDRDSQNITADSIRSVLTPATKAIIAVHLAGWPCEMDAIVQLAREFGLHVIEDCAQAHGATYKGRPVGSLGDVGAFSFCQDKNLTTAGEGGMVTTNSEKLWRLMWSYKDHGKSYDDVYSCQHPWGFRWVHQSFGTNWRLSEVQSAVGRVALRKLPDWVVTRRKHATMLSQRLTQLTGLRIAQPPAHIQHAYYKFYAFVRPDELRPGWNRDRIAQTIASQGVPCSVGSCSEIYLEKAFPPEWHPPARLTVARELGETSLMFLVHPTLLDEHLERTCQVAEQVMRQAASAHAFTSAAALEPSVPSILNTR